MNISNKNNMLLATDGIKYVTTATEKKMQTKKREKIEKANE